MRALGFFAAGLYWIAAALFVDIGHFWWALPFAVFGLPAFLASDAGSNSGFMIAQYTAAALANENRRLAAPASTDGGLTSGWG